MFLINLPEESFLVGFSTKEVSQHHPSIQGGSCFGEGIGLKPIWSFFWALKDLRLPPVPPVHPYIRAKNIITYKSSDPRNLLAEPMRSPRPPPPPRVLFTRTKYHVPIILASGRIKDSLRSKPVNKFCTCSISYTYVAKGIIESSYDFTSPPCLEHVMAED